ncbi:OLC1v1033757C1 [Oldenlandia corymbosa var. corymbosa]|uniref:OLC1v1033757C1 n=1 Tax=Oldenlandia corymbosa var. corymbosa TaxID=529605 RepID=A0AAV1CPS4_OLDCO|nr:OLC1v1033757C1 [Oldenlandia corymbosa var. corymbosa]
MGAIKEKEEESKGKPSSFRLVFKHADGLEKLLMTLGTIGCIVDGMSTSAHMIVLSNLMNAYGRGSVTLHDVNKYALYLLYVAFAVGSGAFLEGFCWARAGERLTSRLRTKYLEAVLRQDVGFFEIVQETSITSQVVSSISTDSLTIQGVLSEKIPNLIANLATFVTSQAAAIYLCWRLAIIGIPALFVLFIPGIVYGKLLMGIGKQIEEAYDVAGGIVQQALSSIRTVYSYIGEEQTVERFSAALEPTLKLGIKQGLLKGMAIGSVGLVFAVWALESWYGSVLVIEKGEKGGNTFTAAVCCIYGGIALGSSLINIKYLAEANVAAGSIFTMIERVPSINSTDQNGETISGVKGELEFKEIDFAYPSRPESLVLKNFNLKIIPCQTVGLVGGSGSGKSTVINLLERFYDPLEGEVLLDGINIKSLQLKWLRKQMALVSQEPILFATSIKENILFGKEDASDDEIIEAAKAANAHNFIIQLPNGYNTLVGQLGTQMSEGQKQRISIARALLVNPKILLLDEATSALDSQSEKAVQDALNQASRGRTTLVVAHRLSALRNADAIAVIQSGKVVELGSHDELVQNKYGPYWMMVLQQKKLMHDDEVRHDSNEEANEAELHIASTADEDDPTKEATNSPANSVIHDEKKTAQQRKDDEYSPPTTLQLLQMTTSHWKSTLCGSLGAFCFGLLPPIHSFCLGALVSVYFTIDHNEIKSQTRTYCYVFIVISIGAFISNLIQHYHFGIMGENLTKTVREATITKILTFEPEWFDHEENNTGALCSRLEKDATYVRSLVADRLAFAVQSVSGLTLAAVLSMALSWRLALVAIALQPVTISAFYLKEMMMTSMSKKILKSQNRSSELASEAVANHRIIAAFYSQDEVMKLFETAQKDPRKESHKQSWYAGLGLFTSQFLAAANMAIIFWYGGRLLYHGDIVFKHIFQTFFIVMAMGKTVGESGSMTSDLSRGTNALMSIFTILKRKSKIEPNDQNGIIPESLSGKIELREVEFFYATRPKLMVLRKLSLRIEAGEVVALVGQSGSGKSTIIRMIERFYDPSKGSVEVDGINIKLYNLRALRSHIAWVGQEPSLFAGTIFENIAYGTATTTEAEVIKAATLANAHEFISSMQDGYGTYCGERGVQLSGGQKQRIALARALLKNAPIFLLDEATSALDSKSENLVQDAIEKTMVGRTCVIVAHRLSTVQNANKIAVVDSGRIIEEGSHEELLNKGEEGAYYTLVKLQHHSMIQSTVTTTKSVKPGVPGSFHGRVFPNSSINLMNSSTSVHWLSQVPDGITKGEGIALWNQGRITYARSSNQVVEAFRAQFYSNMKVFLEARSQELAPGGILSILVPCGPQGIVHSDSIQIQLLECFTDALADMVNEGIICEDLVDSFNLPIYYTMASEMKDIVVSSSTHFSIKTLEEVQIPSSFKTSEDIQLVCTYMRPIFEGAFSRHFGPQIIDEPSEGMLRRSKILSRSHLMLRFQSKVQTMLFYKLP